MICAFQEVCPDTQVVTSFLVAGALPQQLLCRLQTQSACLQHTVLQYAICRMAKLTNFQVPGIASTLLEAVVYACMFLVYGRARHGNSVGLMSIILRMPEDIGGGDEANTLHKGS